MSTGWLSRLLYLLIIHKHILPQGHYIIIIINISLTNSCYIFYCLDLCYDKTVFPPIFVSKFTRYKNIIQTHQFPLFCPQQQRWRRKVRLVLQVFLRVTSTDQYSLPTRYLKAAGIGSFHSTLKMKATRCIGPNVSNVLLSKATRWQKLYSYWLAKQRVAF